MLASRRGFITGLAALCAAPAIVKIDSLMKLRAPKVFAPQAIIHSANGFSLIADGDSICEPVEYFGYDYLYIRPEWALTLDDYSKRILKPMIDQLAENTARSIMYRNDFKLFATEYYKDEVRKVALS